MTPPPTVATLRAQGVTGLRIACAGCDHTANVRWDIVIAKDAEPFPGIKSRLKCSQCGSKRVSIMPDWPATGPGGLPMMRNGE